MINSVIRFALVAALSAPALVCAEPAPASPASAPQRIATLNANRALMESNVFKAAIAEVDTAYKADIDEAKRLERELAALQEKAVKERATMSQSQLAQLQREGTEKQQRLQALAQKVNSARQEKAAEVAQRLEPILKRLVSEVAAAGGYTIVIDQSVVLLGGQSFDLTRTVIEKLNAAN